MGPQPLGHGYQWLMSEYPWRRMRFQWGHNLSVMDTSSKNTPRKTPTTREFQWGHNLSVMDTLRSAVSLEEKMQGFQWGHNLSVMDTVAKCTIS